MPTSTRDYDLALYGATGFVGRQTVAYLSLCAPSELRWAIVGRNRAQLEAVSSNLPGPTYPADILVADSNDAQSVDAFVRRAGVEPAPVIQLDRLPKTDSEGWCWK